MIIQYNPNKKSFVFTQSMYMWQCSYVLVHASPFIDEKITKNDMQK